MYLLIEFNYIPVVSTIIPVALVTIPAPIMGASNDGIVNLMLNISSSSTILSSVTVTLTEVLVALAGIVATRELVSKSSPK